MQENQIMMVLAGMCAIAFFITCIVAFTTETDKQAHINTFIFTLVLPAFLFAIFLFSSPKTFLYIIVSVFLLPYFAAYLTFCILCPIIVIYLRKIIRERK